MQPGDVIFLPLNTFREVYRYRLINLVGNKWVRELKLCCRPKGWKRFIDLLGRMKVEYECPNRSGDEYYGKAER